MRVRETDRNIALLSVVTLLSLTAAGVVAALDPVPVPANAAIKPTANQAPANGQTQVRIVGIPFVPNTNPRQR